MLLKRIRVDGFRNVMDTSIEFNGTINAVLGLNNYGKSNLLGAIDFGKSFIDLPPKYKNRMMRDTNNLPINSTLAEKDFLFEIELLSSNNQDIKYSFSFEWVKKGGKGARIKSELLQIKTSSKYQTYIKRDESLAFYKSSITGRADTKIEVENNELVLKKVMNFETIFYHDVLQEIYKTNFDLHSLLEVDSAFNSIRIEEDDDDDDDSDYYFDSKNGFNIAKVIYNLQTKHPDKYELLTNSLKTLIPSIENLEAICVNFKEYAKIEMEDEDIPFKIPEKLYDVRVKERYNNQVTSIRSLSSGTKRIVLLLTSVVISDIRNQSLISLEELENSIHPSLFQQLLIILTEICPNCRILISSHSPYLVKYLDLNNIYVGIPSVDGVAQFKHIKKSMHKTLYKNARDYGITTGDYIFDLLIESLDDSSVFCSYIHC